MLIDGKMGYFLEDHVTNIVDPIGDIKGKIQAGKAKVTDLPISKPTQFSHDSHWSKDGEIWGKTEQDLRRYNTYIYMYYDKQVCGTYCSIQTCF